MSKNPIPSLGRKVGKVPWVVTTFLGILLVSCTTYTIPVESFKIQMAKARYESSNDTTLTFLDSLGYFINGIDYLFVVDKDSSKQFLKPTPDLQIRTIQKNGERDVFYFDTVFIVDDSLDGGKSRFLINLRKKIPMDSIEKIEIKKKGNYYDEEY